MAQLKLFGEPLPREGRVPDIFDICLTFIELHARETQGIFRISGNKLKIQQIREEFESGQRLDFDQTDDIHDVTGVLRMWLMKLPEPIIPFDYYQKFLEIGKTLDGSKKHLNALRKLIQSLPQLRLALLLRLCRLLRLLSVNADVNRMSPENLAIVMAPNVLRSESEQVSLNSLVETQTVTKLLATMISMYDVVLDGIEAPPPPSVSGGEGSDQNAISKGKRFQSKHVKKSLEDKYEAIREGNNPLAGKRVGDVEIVTPDGLAASQGSSSKVKLNLNLGALRDKSSTADDRNVSLSGSRSARERSASSGSRKRSSSSKKQGADEAAATGLVREDSTNSQTSTNSSGSEDSTKKKSKKEKTSEESSPSVARVRPRGASISVAAPSQMANALEWLLVGQDETRKPVEDDLDEIARHNAEVRRKRDEEFERLQREREARRLKKEEKDRKRKERIKERARIMVETGIDPGSLSSSSDSSDVE